MQVGEVVHIHVDMHTYGIHWLCSACRVRHLLLSFSGVRDTSFVFRLYNMELPDTHKCPRLYLPGHEISHYMDAGSVCVGEDGETSGFEVRRGRVERQRDYLHAFPSISPPSGHGYFFWLMIFAKIQSM